MISVFTQPLRKKIKYICKQRDKEVIITRLRIGKCRLNYYLNKIGCHADGLCIKCHVAETVEHLLIDCTKYDLASAVRSKCKNLKLEPNLVNILTTNSVIDVIYQLIKSNKIIL